jgi:phytoene synthase
MAPPDDKHQRNMAEVRKTARLHAPDLYIAALLAPVHVRDDLIVLAAMWAETGRVALTVGEPTLAQIRLQWWRDALASESGVSGHPVADAFRDVMLRHRLRSDAVVSLIDARQDELAEAPFSDEAAFESYVDAADGNLLRLNAAIRGAQNDENAELFLAGAAQVVGRVRVALDLPFFAAKGRFPVWSAVTGSSAADAFDAEAVPDGRAAIAALAAGARDARTRNKRLFPAISRRLIDAALPIALLEPYLGALENKAHDPLRDVASIAPLSRVARLTWAHIVGRL